VCRSPPDARCAASINGIVQGTCSNGACSYVNLPDQTRCGSGFAPAAAPVTPPVIDNSTAANNSSSATNSSSPITNSSSTENANSDTENTDDSIILRGWTCQTGICESPTRRSVANFAYSASIQAGIIGSALALEKIVTGTFTPDLAALAINAGLIVIGWDGRLQETGLEENTGVGRTQIAFGFIAGSLAVLFGFSLLSTVRETPQTSLAVIAIILAVVWAIPLGLVCTILTEQYEHFDQDMIDTGANIAYNWAYPATIFAAMVNIALAHTILHTGSYSQGFAAFSAITGVIALAWASNHEDEGSYGNSGDFTDTVTSWQSWAIIAGATSLVLGLIMTVRQIGDKKRRDAGAESSPSDNKAVRVVAFLVVVVFFALIGLVSALFSKQYLDRKYSNYGNDMRVIGHRSENYANQVSPFAWDFTIWSSAVVASFGIELLINGWKYPGITALVFAEAANLVGWAAKHTNVGSVQDDWEKLDSITRAWEGVALVAGFLACLGALSLLKSRREAIRPGDATRFHTVSHRESTAGLTGGQGQGQGQPEGRRETINEDDQSLFKTAGSNPRG
jgi:hypothetical protein